MKPKNLTDYQNLTSYHEVVAQLRAFFLSKGYIEINTQSRLSILAACEDPKNIVPYTISGTTWPLPQTGQMWLEYELLKNPELPGVFCSTTSYRDEPHPNPERHLKIFPMFEFESHGTISELKTTLIELFEYLGFGNSETYHEGEYIDMMKKYTTNELTAEHELQMWKDYGPVFLLKNFPSHTHPFFNMKRSSDTALKIDALLYGIETVGAAERSTNVDEMREQFYTISDGQYAQTLFRHFGTERVEQELNEFLNLNFFPRFGAGIGVNRLIRALHLCQQESIDGMYTPARAVQQQTHT